MRRWILFVDIEKTTMKIMRCVAGFGLGWWCICDTMMALQWLRIEMLWKKKKKE